MIAPGGMRLYRILSQIYGRKAAYQYAKRLTKLISGNPIQPHYRTKKQPKAILITYGDHIKSPDYSPLQTLDKFCSSHLKDTFDTIHVLPHYPYTSDDGFSVSDFLSVNPELGSWEDIHRLSNRFGLMFDGVFNHVSASHSWFKGFLEDDPKYRDYFISVHKLTDVSTVTRPRTSPLLVAFDTASGEQYVWATFSADQLDLNYGNPEVLLEIVAIMLEYIRHGADLIRLDAVGFVWKELGTNCMHLPRTHAIIRLLHAVLDQVAPWVKIVTETNVPHHENISYFGNGHNEAHMVYNFALPPLVVHTLQTGDASTLTEWAAALSSPSKETTFFNFTASHDGIGLRGAKNILTDLQIDDMCQRVKERGGLLSMRTDSEGKESVYEMNISFFNAVTNPEAPRKQSVDQFMCSQAIALSLAGVPGVYMHSILGSTNWLDGVEASGQNRTINRQKLDMETIEEELNDPSNLRSQVFYRYRHMLKVHNEETAFDAYSNQKVVPDYGHGVFAIERTTKYRQTRILALHNVTAHSQFIELRGKWLDLVTGNEHQKFIRLAPYQVAWLKKQNNSVRFPGKKRIGKPKT